MEGQCICPLNYEGDNCENGKLFKPRSFSDHFSPLPPLPASPLEASAPFEKPDTRAIYVTVC